MSILQGKYITYGKLINPIDVLNKQKFTLKKKTFYIEVRFGTDLSIHQQLFNNKLYQISTVYLKTNSISPWVSSSS